MFIQYKLYITEQEDTWGFCGVNVEYMICASEGFPVAGGLWSDLEKKMGSRMVCVGEGVDGVGTE